MKRFHIRTKIIEALKEKGLYVETKDNAMQIPVCRWGWTGFSGSRYLSLTLRRTKANPATLSSRS